MNEQFKKRFLSFIWRLGAIVGVAFLDFVADNLGVFNLPPEVVVIAGLVIGEITKWLNPKKNV